MIAQKQNKNKKSTHLIAAKRQAGGVATTDLTARPRRATATVVAEKCIVTANKGSKDC
jgi:hypothetical protein